MIPIPKPKFFDREVPAGQTEDEYFTEITTRQTHILRDAIDRVSTIYYFYKTNYFQLIYPSAIDPAGILMLKSVRNVFEMIGIEPESINFIKEEFNAGNLVKALNEQPKKCPAIVTLDIIGDLSPHIMVATNALKGIKFI